MIAQQHDNAPAAGHGRTALARARPLRRLAKLSRRAKIGVGGAAVVLIAAVALVLAGAHGPARQPGPPPLAKGFSLPALGQPGSTVSLAGYAGRPVIVNFFASWCTPCQRETPLLARYYASQHGRVIIIGVDANDEQAAALRFVHEAGVGYPVGWDPFPAATTTSYGVYALPQTFFLNADHRIVAKVMGAVTARVLARDVALMERPPSQSRG